MQGCFSFRSTRRQATRHGGGGGGDVIVVSRGEGRGGVKIVVSRGELERIVAGVGRRQCWGAAARRHRHVQAPADSLNEQQPAGAHERDPLLRRRPESEASAAVPGRRGEWRPELGGIPEEEASTTACMLRIN